MKRKVISYKNLPTRPPIWNTMLVYLILDYYQASGWIWGVAWTLIAIAWIGVLTAIFQEESVDIMKEGKT